VRALSLPGKSGQLSFVLLARALVQHYQETNYLKKI
jgi:hypothetical protein